MGNHAQRWTIGFCLTIAVLLPAAGFAQGLTKPPVAATKVPAYLPDLVVTRVAFQFVQHLDKASGGTCDLFNVVPTIANTGKAPAKAFRVLLERNQGPGGSFVKPCPLCHWDVASLAGGALLTLDARQFNNCDFPSKFRITADSGNAVVESNEHNNSSVATYLSRQR